MRALHVFRDQTSLAASPELWPAIESALAESTHLLLLASPAAAGSRWVAREIEWWFANRSPSTMFVLLTDGELVWDEESRDFDWNRTTSLPREVMSGRLHGEPLWVDLRWARTSDSLSLRNARFRGAVLDIAAPLHGKDKDALDGEDVRAFARLQRARRAAIAGLATLTVAAVTAATLAVRQRDEAIKQNAIAQAGRLAAQADLLRERGGATDVSVLLASQALTVLESIHERSFEVDLSLRRALAGLPRDIAQFDMTADDVQLSASGNYMRAEVSGGQISVSQLPSGELRSCDREGIEARSDVPRGAVGAVRLMSAASTNGDWCIVQQLDNGDRTTLSLWSARPLTRVDSWQLRTKDGLLTPAVSDDGDVLATTDRAQSGAVAQSTLRLWSRSRRAELLRTEGEEFRGFSPDRHHFATTGGLWLLPERGSPVAKRVIQWTSAPWNLVFSRTGAYIVTRAGPDGPAEIWDVPARRLLRTAKHPAGVVLALRDDARFLAVQVRDSTLLVDTETGDVRAGIPQEAKAAAFATPDPTLLVREAGINGAWRLRILSLPSSGSALATTELPRGATAHHLALNGDNVDALVSTDSSLRVMRWTVKSGEWTTAIALPAPRALHVSRDGTHFAAAIGDSTVVARIDGTGTPKRFLSRTPVTMVALSSDAQYIATLSNDRAVRIDSVAGSTHAKLQLPDTPNAIMVSRDGAYLVALFIDDKTPSRAGASHSLIRMRIANPAQLTTIDLGRYLQPLTSLCMISDDAMFVRAGGARHPFVANSTPLRVGDTDMLECTRLGASAVRVSIDGMQLLASDMRTGQSLARLDHIAPVLRTSVSDDGRRVATVDESGSVRLFALDAKSLIARACERKPRPLTDREWTRYLGVATLVDACGRARPAAAATERASSPP